MIQKNGIGPADKVVGVQSSRGHKIWPKDNKCGAEYCRSSVYHCEDYPRGKDMSARDTGC